MSADAELTAMPVAPEAIEAGESATAAKDSPPVRPVYADLSEGRAERKPVIPAHWRTRAAARQHVTLATLGGASLVACRLRHRPPLALPPRIIRAQPAPPPVQHRTEPQALPARQEVHLHFHGVTAEDVAAIVAGVRRDLQAGVGLAAGRGRGRPMCRAAPG